MTPDIADVPAAILAGGRATRLGSLAHDVPKALLEVAGRPFVDHQLDLLRRHGIRRVVMCLGHLAQPLRAHLGDGTAHGLEIRYSEDGPRSLGTGGALRRAAPLLGDVFWVLYGDSYTDIDFRSVLRHFLGTRALGCMTVLRNDNRWDRSNAVFRDDHLLRYDKRAVAPDMTHIDYGVTLLRRTALDRIPLDTEYDLADLYRILVEERDMVGYEVARRFYEIGSRDGLAETRAWFAASRR